VAVTGQVRLATYHIVGANEVFEGERRGQSRVGRQGFGADNGEQCQRVLRLGCFLFESELGCRVTCLLAGKVAVEEG
jgi:hypothetical protein